MDDLNILHVNEKMVDDKIVQLDSEFRTQNALMVSSGTSHEYLGMMLDFLNPVQSVVTMIGSIDMVLSGTPAEMSGTAVTPAAGHLLCTSHVAAPPLMGDVKDLIHHITMQLAYLAQRAHPDI